MTLTETITWHRVEDELPDEDTTVLMYCPEGAEYVWPGYLDGGRWHDAASAFPMDEGLVYAWAHMLKGPQS